MEVCRPTMFRPLRIKKSIKLLQNCNAYSTKLIMKKIVFLVSFMSFIIASTSFGQSKIKAIKAGKLIDVVTGTILTNQIILVDSNLIIAIGSIRI